MSDARRSMYENSGPWEKNVPADLIPAIKHLRKSFDDAHWGCGQTTQKFCYSILHGMAADDSDEEYFNYFRGIKILIGPDASQRFHDMFRRGTPSALFKAYYDLYLEGMSAQALLIFKDLVEIGRANEVRLNMPHLEWAEAQTEHLIRSNNHLIRLWVRNVCDKQIYDPKEDMEELAFWRKWQAPMFLVMQPSRFAPYDPEKVWERNDAETSSQLLESFVEHYVLHLEDNLKRVAGEAALALAKQPRPKQTNAAESNPKLPDIPSPEPTLRRKDPAVRREARKLDTQAKQAKWQKEYRRLKRSRPGMSDVWYSQRIAEMDMAEGRSAETIRKHMTK